MARLNEKVMVASAPVYTGRFYVVDGQVVRSPIRGTVAELKEHLWRVEKMEAQVVKECDVRGRGLV